MDEQIKKELQEKIDEAQKLFDQKPIVQTIFTTAKPTNTLNAGILMGDGHDRQDLGIQIEKDSVMKIKQINPNFKSNLTLRLLTNDSHTENMVQVGYTTVFFGLLKQVILQMHVGGHCMKPDTDIRDISWEEE